MRTTTRRSTKGNDCLRVEWDLQASRTGSVVCGPASGAMHISANFAMTPSNLTIDP